MVYFSLFSFDFVTRFWHWSDFEDDPKITKESRPLYRSQDSSMSFTLTVTTYLQPRTYMTG